MIHFYDTCSLLSLQQKAFESKFIISNITLIELESIKTSGTKDEDTKYAARKLLHLLQQNKDLYTVKIYNSFDDTWINNNHLILNNDSRIIATAKGIQDTGTDILFITSDMSCEAIARSIGLKTKFETIEDNDHYTGYKEIKMSDEELANFYSNILINNDNLYELLNNEYLLIVDNSNKVIDKYKWSNEKYIKVPFIKAESKMFGKITPKDSYQQIALDSLNNNQITVLRGKPGSGKSCLALAYLIQQLEKGHINKIVIFANTVAVRGAAKLGYYPGSKDSKLLDSQIGNFLATKFGNIIEVERMIEDGVLMLIPVADCRGIDLTGMNAGVLFTESQNTSVDMMKLVLQRVGEDSICIFEGDDKSQVDMKEYSGKNNGLKRISEVFRGDKIYGEVTLKNIHRSRIAQLAELM